MDFYCVFLPAQYWRPNLPVSQRHLRNQFIGAGSDFLGGLVQAIVDLMFRQGISLVCVSFRFRHLGSRVEVAITSIGISNLLLSAALWQKITRNEAEDKLVSKSYAAPPTNYLQNINHLLVIALLPKTVLIYSGEGEMHVFWGARWSPSPRAPLSRATLGVGQVDREIMRWLELGKSSCSVVKWLALICWCLDDPCDCKPDKPPGEVLLCHVIHLLTYCISIFKLVLSLQCRSVADLIMIRALLWNDPEWLNMCLPVSVY